MGVGHDPVGPANVPVDGPGLLEGPLEEEGAADREIAQRMGGRSTKSFHLPCMVRRALAMKAIPGTRMSTPETEAKDLSHSGTGAPIMWCAPGVE